jgi:PQQ-dependent dehydrogenase (methanol/ethanol family)
MISLFKTMLLSLAISAVPGLSFGQASSQKVAHPSDSDWSMLGRTSDMQHNSPLAQINDTTVKKLGLAWVTDIPSKDGLVGNPLVVDGVVFQSGPMGRIYANDVRTGKLLWQFDADVKFDGATLDTFWSVRHNRGVAVLDDKVIVAVGDCRLIAVDRKTGRKVWEAVSCDRSGTYGITGAPRVGGGMVFIGNNCIDSGMERGFVDAFDAKTGARKWRFYTVPGDPAKPQDNAVMEMAAKTWGEDWYSKTHGCGSPWDAITYDPKLNLLYIGTGGPAPFSPAERGRNAGDELFTNSIVAVKADTGEYVWHYKTTPQDGWNFDATMHLMVAELPLQGKSRRVVMTAPKNGFFYVLDAQTGKFISAKNFTPVNWASHIDQATGRPVTIPDARYWERPHEKTVASPGPYGAHNWQAMAFNQATGLVYIPVIVAPTLIELDPKAKVGGMSFDMYYGTTGKDPKWTSYGELVAWDPVAQKARWRVRQRMPINGGTLTTSGNLVFQGTADGQVNAFAADTGERLWSYDVGASVQAAPTTVQIDGEQIVLVSAGNAASATPGTYMARYGTTPATRSQARLLAFKLGGTAALPAAKAQAKFNKPPRPRQPESLARIGENRYEQHFCVDCHGLKAESSGGSIPDLRRASGETHDLFAGIVLGGLRKDKGMPIFTDVTMDDLQAIQAYLINASWDAYTAQEEVLGTRRVAKPKH